MAKQSPRPWVVPSLDIKKDKEMERDQRVLEKEPVNTSRWKKK